MPEGGWIRATRGKRSPSTDLLDENSALKNAEILLNISETGSLIQVQFVSDFISIESNQK